MRGDARAGLLALRRGLKQEFSDLASAQTLNQIIKWAVLKPPAAAAVLFAAGQVLADIGGTHQTRRQLASRQQRGLALLQGRKVKFVKRQCLNHIYS